MACSQALAARPKAHQARFQVLRIGSNLAHREQLPFIPCRVMYGAGNTDELTGPFLLQTKPKGTGALPVKSGGKQAAAPDKAATKPPTKAGTKV